MAVLGRAISIGGFGREDSYTLRAEDNAKSGRVYVALFHVQNARNDKILYYLISYIFFSLSSSRIGTNDRFCFLFIFFL